MVWPVLPAQGTQMLWWYWGCWMLPATSSLFLWPKQWGWSRHTLNSFVTERDMKKEKQIKLFLQHFHKILQEYAVTVSSSEDLCKMPILCTLRKSGKRWIILMLYFFLSLMFVPHEHVKYGGSCRFCSFSHIIGRWVGICCPLSPNPQISFLAAS